MLGLTPRADRTKHYAQDVNHQSIQGGSEANLKAARNHALRSFKTFHHREGVIKPYQLCKHTNSQG